MCGQDGAGLGVVVDDAGRGVVDALPLPEIPRADGDEGIGEKLRVEGEDLFGVVLNAEFGKEGVGEFFCPPGRHDAGCATRESRDVMVQTIGCGGGEQRGRGVCAGAVAGDGDFVRVAAEARDVLLHPLECGDDVLDAEVRGVFECSAVVGEGEPSEGAEPVVEGNADRAAGSGESGRVRGCLGVRAELPASAEDVDDHRQWLGTRIFRCPDVEVQAVFAESVVGLEPGGSASLEGCGPLLVVGKVGVVWDQNRAVEAFGSGERDAQP